MSDSLVYENVWTERPIYEEAEERYYESLSKTAALTPLANEVAKARQRLSEIRDNFEPNPDIVIPSSIDVEATKFLEKKVLEMQKLITTMENKFPQFEQRLQALEDRLKEVQVPLKSHAIELPTPKPMEEDDDVDLFGSDSEDDAEADKIREERLAAYNTKKSKKPALIAKSSIILDIKPWDDETNMKEMEESVRKIEMEGLLWGASKLVPLAYGIKKLQINCVIEDEKVSVDLLQEQIEEIDSLVQSVDIAAFNKI